MININSQERELPGVAWMIGEIWAAGSTGTPAEGEPSGERVEPELEEVARTEREYVRRRLREELNREPTEEEMDEWLRQQTEGH